MKVGVGSLNPTKFAAVARALGKCPGFAAAEVVKVKVSVEEFGHPKTLKETIEGAISRARQAQEGRDYGFGIEGGLMEVPYTKTGYMEVAACAIYDGTRVYLGLSSAFEWPPSVLALILSGLDGSQAVQAAGLSAREKLGTEEGFVGLFTDGRVDRTQFNEFAVVMAMMQLEHPEHY